MRRLDLPPYPFHVALVIGKAEWLEHASHTDQEDLRWLGEHVMGQVCESDTGGSCLVRLHEDAEDDMLVHEAVHVVQQLCNWTGEENPGDEFQAYTTQHVFKWLKANMDQFKSAASNQVQDAKPEDEPKGDEPVVDAKLEQEPS